MGSSTLFITMVCLAQKPDTTQSTHRQLRAAFKADDVAAIKALLPKLEDPNCADAEGHTLLRDAIWMPQKKKAEIIRLMVQAGADVNRPLMQFGEEVSSLFVGIDTGDSDIVALLLELGADPDAIIEYGRQTALHHAVAMENVQAIKALLAAGAKTDIEDGSSRTPMDLAKKTGNQAVIEAVGGNRILTKINRALTPSKRTKDADSSAVGKRDDGVPVWLIAAGIGCALVVVFLLSLFLRPAVPSDRRRGPRRAKFGDSTRAQTERGDSGHEPRGVSRGATSAGTAEPAARERAEPVQKTGKKLAPLAVVSLAAVFVLGFIGAPVAIICGHLAKAQIKKDPNLSGRGLATAGLVLGYLTLLAAVAVGILMSPLGEGLRKYLEG